MWFEARGWLPEKDGLYLCWHKDWSMEVVRYRKSIPGIDGFDTMGAGGNLPMFWMPLPKPPTADNKETQPETAVRTLAGVAPTTGKAAQCPACGGKLVSTQTYCPKCKEDWDLST